MNPLYSSLNQTQSGAGIEQLKQIFKASNNPMALFTLMAQNKPELQPLLQMMNQGVSPEQIVKNECSKRGIDYNQFMNQLTK